MTATLHHGDCLEVMKGLPDGSVDAIIADPPWMDYETGHYDASEWHKPIKYVSPFDYCDSLYRLASNESALILWCRWDVFDLHRQAATKAGFDVVNQIVWAKPNHTGGDLWGNIGNQHECAVFATKGKWRRDGKREVNLWRMPHLFSRDYRSHPTEKPVDLMRRCVRLCCAPGDTVLDPFMGSGTTGVACMKEERRFIGIELERQYFDIASRRIAEAAMQIPLFSEATE